MPGRRRPADAAGHGADRSAARRRERRARSTLAPPGRRLGPRRRAGRGLRGPGPRHRGPGLRGRGRVAVVGRVAGRRHPGDRRRPRRASPTPARSTTTSLAETLAEARDNAAFGTPDECARPGRARRRAAGRPRPLARRRWPRSPTDDKVDAGPRARAGRRGPATPASAASSRPTTATRSAEAAVATTTGIRAVGARDRAATSSAYAIAGEGDETQTGFGFSVGREPGRPRPGRARPPTPPTGPPAARRDASRGRERLTVVLDPRVTAQFLGILAGTLNGEAVLKGRSLFADRLGERGRRRRS